MSDEQIDRLTMGEFNTKIKMLETIYELERNITANAIGLAFGGGKDDRVESNENAVDMLKKYEIDIPEGLLDK